MHIIPDLTQIGDEERLGLIGYFSEPDANGQLHPTSAVLEVDVVVAKDAVIQFGSTSVVNWDTFSQMKSKTAMQALKSCQNNLIQRGLTKKQLKYTAKTILRSLQTRVVSRQALLVRKWMLILTLTRLRGHGGFSFTTASGPARTEDCAADFWQL